MGNDASRMETHANVDKRTARRMHSESFKNAITILRGNSSDLCADFKFAAKNDGSVKIYCRKRPMFEREGKRGEFDCVSADLPDGKTVCVHDGRMHSDMKRMFFNNTSIGFSKVFSEHDDNNTVVSVVIPSLVQRALKGFTSTCFMFGQTGSGKTYTLNAIAKHVATLLPLDEDKQFQIAFTAFELAGNTANDLLLETKHNRKVGNVKLLTDENGFVQPHGATIENVHSKARLIQAFEHAWSLRAAASTAVHDASSRSHAVYTLKCPNGGQLILVDLAGSERNHDARGHDASRRMEAAEINSSLMALKECIRAHAVAAVSGKQNVFVPYRASKLTMVLRSSLDSNQSHLAVVVTVSPCSCDTEHSVHTLLHAALMNNEQIGNGETVNGKGKGNGRGKGVVVMDGTDASLFESLSCLKRWKTNVVSMQDIRMQQYVKTSKHSHPKTWGKEETMEWYQRAVARAAGKEVVARIEPHCDVTVNGKGKGLPIPPGITGASLVRLTEKRIQLLCRDMFTNPDFAASDSTLVAASVIKHIKSVIAAANDEKKQHLEARREANGKSTRLGAIRISDDVKKTEVRMGRKKMNDEVKEQERYLRQLAANEGDEKVGLNTGKAY